VQEPVSLEEAAENDRIDLFEFPGETQFIANSFEPVTIAGTASALKLTVTKMTDEGALVTLAYGPLDGDVQIATGEEGTEVLQNGTPVIGTVVEGGEPQPKPGSGGSGDGGGSGGGGPSPGGAVGPGSGAPSALFEVARVKTDSHGDITLSLLAPGPGVFRARSTTAVPGRSAGARGSRTHTVIYGTATGKASGAGAVRLVIGPDRAGRRALARSARLKVSVSITFTASGGPTHSTAMKVPIARSRRR
jgi:hypothetical protein